MSKTIGKASLEADEEGLVTLQCDRCKSRFKMDCVSLNDELEEMCIRDSVRDVVANWNQILGRIDQVSRSMLLDVRISVSEAGKLVLAFTPVSYTHLIQVFPIK